MYNTEFEDFGLSIAAFYEFESILKSIPVNKAKPALIKVRELSARLFQEDDCLYADVQIVIAYLQKLVAIVDQSANRSLFRKINMESIQYHKDFPELGSENLVEVLFASGVYLQEYSRSEVY